MLGALSFIYFIVLVIMNLPSTLQHKNFYCYKYGVFAGDFLDFNPDSPGPLRLDWPYLYRTKSDKKAAVILFNCGDEALIYFYDNPRNCNESGLSIYEEHSYF